MMTQLIVDEIDVRRLQYTAQLFKNIGYSKKQSEIKANIFFKYLLGHHELNKYKKQPKNYIVGVKKELKHFLDL